MEKYIDCENLDTMRLSLSAILGIRQEVLNDAARTMDPETDYVLDPTIKCAGEALLRRFERNGAVAKVDGAYWFHLTRAADDCTFSKGILPLSHALPRLLDFLGVLSRPDVDEEAWDAFCKRYMAQPPSPYSNVRMTPSYEQDGPCGFLAYDLPCFTPKATDSHYHKSPEIIAEICRVAGQHFRVDLQKRFHGATKPYIVKYAWPNAERKDLAFAFRLFWMCTKADRQSMPFEYQRTMNAYGQCIPPKSITKVGMIDDSGDSMTIWRRLT